MFIDNKRKLKAALILICLAVACLASILSAINFAQVSANAANLEQEVNDGELMEFVSVKPINSGK